MAQGNAPAHVIKHAEKPGILAEIWINETGAGERFYNVELSRKYARVKDPEAGNPDHWGKAHSFAAGDQFNAALQVAQQAQDWIQAHPLDAPASEVA